MPVWFSSASQNRKSIRLLLCLSLLVSGLYGPALLAQTFTPGNSPFSESRFLPVDEAFSYYTSIDSRTQLTVNWQIAEGYYLYQEKFAFAYIAQAAESDTIPLSYKLPVGVAHHDEFFGAVDVYYLGAAATLTLPADIPEVFTLVIEYQGCSEDGLCYPPQRREIEILL